MKDDHHSTDDWYMNYHNVASLQLQQQHYTQQYKQESFTAIAEIADHTVFIQS